MVAVLPLLLKHARHKTLIIRCRDPSVCLKQIEQPLNFCPKVCSCIQKICLKKIKYVFMVNLAIYQNDIHTKIVNGFIFNHTYLEYEMSETIYSYIGLS